MAPTNPVEKESKMRRINGAAKAAEDSVSILNGHPESKLQLAGPSLSPFPHTPVARRAPEKPIDKHYRDPNIESEH